MKARPRIVFLFSDTGGGHRSAAEAVMEAVEDLAGADVDVQMVDFFKDHAPFPFRRLPHMYPSMVKVPAGWGFGYKISNTPGRARLVSSLIWPLVSKSARTIMGEQPPDMLVSFHPLANEFIARELARRPEVDRPPFIVVVTDLVSTHAFWFSGARDLTIVPTDPAHRNAVACGLSPQNVQVVGLPVAAKFCSKSADRPTLRSQLGWDAEKRVVLIVGGGEGMGPLEETTRAIANSGMDVGIAVVCGRNRALNERLNAAAWPVPVYVYGFVRNMPDLMRAADVLVTKGGPGTISEGLNAGLPVVVYSYLPGQEAGNVPYLTESGAGIWAPTPADVAAGLRVWLENENAYNRAAESAKHLARPEAAKEIARLLLRKIKE